MEIQSFYNIVEPFKAVFLDSYGVLKNHRGLIAGVQQTVDFIRERGIALVVSSHYARRDRRGDVHGALAHYMDSVLAGTGIPYLDYTNAPDIEDQNWFADHGHLNGTGARIFTGQLMDSLEAMGYLRKP